jgi:hypothetical protein
VPHAISTPLAGKKRLVVHHRHERQASPIAFRSAGAAGTRRAASATTQSAAANATGFRELWAMVGQLEQRAARLTPRPERLRRLRTLASQLQTLRRHASTLALSDTALGLLEAAVTHLQRLLDLAKELDEVDRALTDRLPTSGPEPWVRCRAHMSRRVSPDSAVIGSV